MPSFENRVETLRKEFDRLARENQALRQFVELYKSFTTESDTPEVPPKQVGFFQAEALDDGSVKFAAPDEHAHRFFAGDIHVTPDSDLTSAFSPDLEKYCREVIKTRKKKSVEIPHRKGDKSYTLRFDLIPYFDFYQQVKRIACYVLDVTETYKSPGIVDAIDRAFDKFSSLSESVAWSYDPGMGTMRWSEGVEKLTGEQAGKISGDSRKWLALVHPEDVTRVKAAFQRLISDGLPYNIVYNVRRKDGSYVACREQAHVVRDVDGTVLRAFGTVTMKDGQPQTTFARSAEIERYLSLLKSTNDIVVECDSEGRILSMNDRGAEALGYEQDEGGTHWLDDYFYFSDGASYSMWLKNVLAAPRRNMEMRTIRAGRVRLYLNCHTTPMAGKEEAEGFILVATDVTTQRQALQEFRSIFESSRDGIILHRRGIIQRVNKAASRLFGVGDPAQFTEKNILDLVHPDDRERIRKYLEQSLQGKEWPGFFEMRGLRTNGSSIDLEVSASYLSFEDEPTFMLITRDITQRKLAEGLLKQSESFFRTLIEHSPDFVVLTDREGITMYVNPAFSKLLEHDPSFLANKNPLSIVHPKDRFKCLRAAVKVETTLGPARVDVRLPHAQGDWIEFEAMIVPLVGPGGHIDQYFISARDVSERKKAEARATQGESRYRVLFDAASDGLFVFNASGLIIDVNTSACELTGYEKEELLGETIRFLMFPEDLSAVEDDPYLYVASKTPRERRIRRKDGTEIWVDHRISVFDIDGEPQLLVISKDITQERRLRRELEFEHAFTESVIKSIEPMRVIDVDSWRVVSLNPKAKEFYRQANSAGEDVSCGQVEHAEAQCTERDCPIHLALNQYQPVPVERYLPKMDRWVWLCGYPFTVRDKRYVAEVVRDITEQKKLEEHVAQAQKMDAIGTLAGGIAHDFNNLLGGIIGFTSLMRMKLGKDNPLQSTVDGIEKSARRAAALTEQLLGFTRAGGRKVESVDLNAIVNSVIELVGRTFQKHVAVKKSLQTGLWKIEGDGAQFEHCLLNLCINARDAMPDGGTLTITTANVTVKRDGSKLGRVLPPGPYVLLKVADTGVGMTPDIKSHIFEPFFSTKPKGKGTGLGLAMVYGIVKAYHGHINVESEVGQGSVFSLYFPAAEEHTTVEPQREEREPEQGSGMIILADDEDVMREVTKEILEALGYSVIDTPDGNEVMPLLEKYADRVSCVILDVLMPGVSGIEIYKKIRKTYDRVKVLITSGYYPEGEARELIESEDVVFLQKPFTVEQLAQSLAGVIDAEPK